VSKETEVVSQRVVVSLAALRELLRVSVRNS
jgi:hypothetical protein